MFSRIKKSVLAAVLCLPALALAESGTVVRATQLVATPHADAATRGVLRSEQAVDIIERRGGWYHVATDDGREGWLRLSSVRLGEVRREDEGGGFWASLFSFTGRSEARTASATTGIRGLSEEEIHAATPDMAAVERLATFAADDADAQAFAGELGLAAREIKPLPRAKPKGGAR